MDVSTTNALLVPQLPTVKVAPHQWGDLAWQVGPAVASGLLIALFLTVGRRVMLKALEKHFIAKGRTGWPLWAHEALATLRVWFIGAAALYAAIKMAPPAKPVFALADYVFTIVLIVQFGVVLMAILRHTARAYTTAHKHDGARVMLTHTMAMVAEIGVWVLVGLMLMNASGINVTALLAGLGIGGVAIAFAFKSIMEDMFASLSVVMDKPFVIGDFISFGDLMGTVESIGMKTTRVRALSGEQLVISNADLMGSRIRNYGRMSERRQVFTLGVTYETPADKLEQIPHMVQEIIAAQPHARFDRCHFATYGDFSLNFETVYYVTVADYTVYMDTQQAINLAIFKAFAAEGIAFAYPTQTLYATVGGAGSLKS